MTYAEDIGFVELESDVVLLMSGAGVDACVKFAVVAGFIDPANVNDWNVMILPIAGFYDKTVLYRRWYSSDVTLNY